MHSLIKQSTASQTITYGPVTNADGTAYVTDNLVYGDFVVAKNGTWGALSNCTIAHVAGDVNGNFKITLATGDIDTIGRLELSLNKATLMGPIYRGTVLVASTYDALITNAAGATLGLATGVNQTGDSYARLGAPVSTSISADIANISTAITAGVASTLTATADRYTTDASANRVNSYTATFLSNGTNWITAPTTPAVAEVNAAGSPFWLNVGLLYVAATNQYANSVTIRGFFSAGAARNVNVYAYNYLTKTQDQLSDATTRMATATTNQIYTYTLLSAHQKQTAAVQTTSAGSNFSAAGTTVTANVTGHGFTTGDVVTISGITTLTNANGTFMVTRVNDNQFTYPILTQTATGAGTATMTTDAVGSIRIGFKEGTTSSYNAADRLNIDQCVINVASAGPSAADIASAVYAKMIGAVYSGGVWLDTISGVDGYVPGTNGIDTAPVLTLACAYSLCSTLNLRRIYFKTGSHAVPVTLTQSAANWRFIGAGAIDLGGQAITNARFESLYNVYGTSTGADSEFRDCGLAEGGLTIDHAYMIGCRLKGKVTLIANAESHIFERCIDATGAGAECEIGFVSNATIVMRDFRGAVKLSALGASNSAVIDGATRLVIDGTSTAGSITFRGFASAITGATAFLAAGGTITQTARYGTDQNIGVDWGNVANKTATVALPNTTTADPPGVSTLLARIGAWTGTGINTVLGAFRAMMAKAVALTPTDISSGTTFDNTTDSEEAQRDRLDALIPQVLEFTTDGGNHYVKTDQLAIGGSTTAAAAQSTLFGNAVSGTAATGGSSSTIKLQSGHVCQPGDMITVTTETGGPDTKAVKTFDVDTRIATIESSGWRSGTAPDGLGYIIFGRVTPP